MVERVIPLLSFGKIKYFYYPPSRLEKLLKHPQLNNGNVQVVMRMPQEALEVDKEVVVVKVVLADRLGGLVGKEVHPLNSWLNLIRMETAN